MIYPRNKHLWKAKAKGGKLLNLGIPVQQLHLIAFSLCIICHPASLYVVQLDEGYSMVHVCLSDSPNRW